MELRNNNPHGRQGRLTIFFGYASGVGKTHAMLKAARGTAQNAPDIVAGFIVPNLGPDTAELLEGLEKLPPLKITHNNILHNEFHLDEALKRKPDIILIDDLAHINQEGCRHTRRYQDVEELLYAGIDVYTTVNVQQIESLNDKVAYITGMKIKERIPDRIFDGADQVKLVDIEPQELLERLNSDSAGQDHVIKASYHFYTEENLIALRELALRRCADRMNKISESARTKSSSEYSADEHILVCLSSSPSNPKIIRNAARIAQAFKCSFTALFVETPELLSMNQEDKQRLRNNMTLAKQLGAVIETVSGDDIAFQIGEYARLSGVSKIVLGRNSAIKKHLFAKPSLTERLIECSPDLDIYVIPDKEAIVYKRNKVRKEKISFDPFDLLKSILVLGGATLIGGIFYLLGFSEVNTITVYILGVLITAIITRQRIYSLISSIVSVLVFNFFFTDPKFTFNAYDSGYPATFLIMFLAAFLTSSLAVKIKQHARQAAQTSFRTQILFETNQLLQKAKGKDRIITVTAGQLTRLLERDVIFYPAENGALGEAAIFAGGKEDDLAAGREDSLSAHKKEEYTNKNEQSVAMWVFQNNKHAGATTNTLAFAKCLYLAVRVNHNVYGVIGIVMNKTALDAFENSILLSILGECALAMENEEVAREREKASLLAQNEQLRANLLRSISHDLRTPLTSISGNAGILLSSGQEISQEKKQQLYTDIYDDSLWLINLVENLLSITRIEDGTMKLRLSAQLVDEVIVEAIRHIGRKSNEHVITVKSSDDFLLAMMDARLIMQVIINIVDNAVKYTQKDSHIEVSSKKQDGKILIEISDDGPGIPNEAKSEIFEMFVTAAPGSADSRRGLGLGLALCKSIMNAHGGEISVRDNEPRGTVFQLWMEIREVSLHE